MLVQESESEDEAEEEEVKEIKLDNLMSRAGLAKPFFRQVPLSEYEQ